MQSIVALSTTESEYIPITDAIEEAIWLKGVMSEIGFLNGSVIVFSLIVSQKCIYVKTKFFMTELNI